MRHVASYDVAARIVVGGRSLLEAVKETVFSVLPKDSGGLIAVDTNGNMAMEFNSLVKIIIRKFMYHIPTPL